MMKTAALLALIATCASAVTVWKKTSACNVQAVVAIPGVSRSFYAVGWYQDTGAMWMRTCVELWTEGAASATWVAKVGSQYGELQVLSNWAADRSGDLILTGSVRPVMSSSVTNAWTARIAFANGTVTWVNQRPQRSAVAGCTPSGLYAAPLSGTQLIFVDAESCDASSQFIVSVVSTASGQVQSSVVSPHWANAAVLSADATRLFVLTWIGDATAPGAVLTFATASAMSATPLWTSAGRGFVAMEAVSTAAGGCLAVACETCAVPGTQLLRCSDGAALWRSTRGGIQLVSNADGSRIAVAGISNPKESSLAKWLVNVSSIATATGAVQWSATPTTASGVIIKTANTLNMLGGWKFDNSNNLLAAFSCLSCSQQTAQQYSFTTAGAKNWLVQSLANAGGATNVVMALQSNGRQAMVSGGLLKVVYSIEL